MTTIVARSSRTLLGGLAAATLALTAVIALPGSAGAAQSNVGLGTATSYAVLAGSAVSNTGVSVIDGDLGVSPDTAVSGFPPGVLNGTLHAADGAALQAQTDLTVAYNAAAGSGPALAVATELGGTTVGPGVYTAGTFGMTGTLTLDAGGDPDAVFLFQTPDTLITASNSKVQLIGSANPCNVFWQVGSSATLGTGTNFVGTILALTSITATTGATVDGRLLARNGAVTLDTNVVTRPTCATLPAGTTTTAPTTTTTAAPTTTAVGTTSTTAVGTTTTAVGTTSTTVVGTTSTTAAPTTTTTAAPVSTTTAAPSTTTVPISSSTTSVGTPTTLVEGAVTSTVVSSTTPVISQTPGGPGGSTTTSAPGGPQAPTSPPAITTTTLARTGFAAGPWAAAGLALVVIGGLFVLTERRRIQAAA